MMKMNDLTKIYIEVQIEKHQVDTIDHISPVVNINLPSIPSVPFDPFPAEEKIEWDRDNSKHKVYNTD